jgi:prepilin-type N-terminal cleavage/methylation domain-containing protein
MLLGGVNPAYSKGFTLAEVLITLGIVGVIASLTMPTLFQSYQKQVVVNRLKKVYSVLSQATLMPYGESNGIYSDLLGIGGNTSGDKTEKFFTNYWLPHFSSPNIANDSFYSDTDAYYRLDGNKVGIRIITSYANDRVSYSTSDGTIYTVFIKTTSSKDENNTERYEYSSSMNIYVDINGTKNPNTLGKDVFIFTADFTKNQVIPYGADLDEETINNNCNKNSSGTTCATKIINAGWKIAEDYPW